MSKGRREREGQELSVPLDSSSKEIEDKEEEELKKERGEKES